MTDDTIAADEFAGDETPDGHVNADEFEAGPVTDLPDLTGPDSGGAVADAA